MSKYGNVYTEVDGIRFASAKEARRWSELRLLERAGIIQNLERQKPYAIRVNGVLITTYKSDFDYTENGVQVTEDSKGFRTPVFNLKAKLFAAIHGRKILIT